MDEDTKVEAAFSNVDGHLGELIEVWGLYNNPAAAKRETVYGKIMLGIVDEVISGLNELKSALQEEVG